MTAEAPNAELCSKRPRLDLSAPAPGNVDAAVPSAGGEAAAAAAAAAGGHADGSPRVLVAVPVIGDQMAGSDLVPALQQLLSVYQVEYWARLEELRAKHSACPDAAAGSSASVAAGTSNTSMQQLWQASLAADGCQKPHQQQSKEAQHSSARQQQDQEEQQEAGMTSPFAAATQSYGDQRCGFATDAIDRQQQQQLAVPTVQQAELLLQKLPAGDQDAGAADAQQLQEWRQRWNAVSSSVAGLEQLASAATMQYMDAQGGLACLCGQHGRWVLRRSAVSIGRSTDAKGDVDIDLGKAAGEAGVGSKVSRLQAQLLLTADGSWSITNTGRGALAVNGEQVLHGSTVPLPHLSLLEVSSLSLMFMVNSMAVKRAVTRSVHLAM